MIPVTKIYLLYLPTALIIADRVSYRVPRPIHRPMHRSIYRSLLDRPSTDTRPTCRSTIDRESTDVFIELPLMSAEVSTVTISGAYRSTIGGMSVVYHSIVERESTHTMCRSIERYYRPIYRPILDTIYPYIDRYYRPIVDTIDRFIDRYID